MFDCLPKLLKAEFWTFQILELVLICIFGLGGDFDADRIIDDLKLLYRAYVSDSLSSGRIEENKVNK